MLFKELLYDQVIQLLVGASKDWILTNKESKRAEEGEEGTPKWRCVAPSAGDVLHQPCFIHPSSIHDGAEMMDREEQRLVLMQPTSRGRGGGW